MTTISWETEFDTRFFSPSIPSPSDLKKFIRNLLLMQKEEVRGIVEGMRREPTLCGECNLNGDLCQRCYANRQVNYALEKVLSALEDTTTSPTAS